MQNLQFGLIHCFPNTHVPPPPTLINLSLCFNKRYPKTHPAHKHLRSPIFIRTIFDFTIMKHKQPLLIVVLSDLNPITRWFKKYTKPLYITTERCQISKQNK